MDLLTVVGARPQFVKASAVSSYIATESALTEFLVHTGQHYDVAMSQGQFEALGLREADLNLGISGGSGGDMIGRMISGLDTVIERVQPKAVLVYGDTRSTLAATIAAVNRHVPVAHVEAGLRSHDREMPEEQNRLVADHLATLLFCPTQISVRNLAREGVTSGVSWVGDVMLDVFLKNRPSEEETARLLSQLNLRAGRYVLATLHRAATTGTREALESRIDYLRGFGAPSQFASDGLEVVLPLHPRTREALEQFGIGTDGIRVLDPLDYRAFSALLAGCAVVATDSGGVQKEAYFHRVPCVTLRSETEWPETIAAGWNRLWTSDEWTEPRQTIADYGQGDASPKIVEGIQDFISK